MFYYTYILKSKKDGKLYTGYTSNLRERLTEHNKNVSGYTKGRGPFILIYYEACLSKLKAWSRELYLKTGMGKRFLKHRIGAPYL